MPEYIHLGFALHLYHDSDKGIRFCDISQSNGQVISLDEKRALEMAEVIIKTFRGSE